MQETGAGHLFKADTVLANLVTRFGTPTPTKHGNYYQELVESIISQQLSVKAADSILRKFIALFNANDFPSPTQILEKDVETLRTAGLSRPKARYILDLAEHIESGKIKFDHLDTLTNDEITAELTAVKGIGEWTVHMFLIFCMGRSDVLAWGDLGIRNGMQKLYGLDTIPDRATAESIATQNKWHPYESYACWYIWKSLDNEPTTP